MSNTLYLGNLPAHTRDQDLFKLIQATEPAQLPKVRLSRPGDAPRYAFVDLTDPQEAERLAAQLQGADLAGRRLTVLVLQSRATA